MKLTPAVNYLNAIGESVMTDCFANKKSGPPGERTEKLVRQIQADALRAAADIVRSGHFIHDEAPDARLARSAAAAIEREANQLHPLREGKKP